MLKSKKILSTVAVCLTVAALSIGGVIAYAANDDKQPTTTTKTSAEIQVVSEKCPKTPADFAAEMGIDTKDMTNEQIGTAVKNQILLEQAAQYGIDTTGMTEEQVLQAIEPFYFAEQKAYAAKLGVDSTGMTTGDQVRTAIRAFKANGWSKPVNPVGK